MNFRNALYVSDLDGTLLNQESKVSNRSASILNNLIREGVNFTVATSRTPATVMPICQNIDIRLPMVVMTGAATWNPKEERFINITRISPEYSDTIFNICAHEQLNPFFYVVKEDNMSHIAVFHAIDLNEQEQRFVEERNSSPYKKFELGSVPLNLAPTLIFLYDKYEKVELVNRYIKSKTPCFTVCYHDIFNEELGYLEIFDHGVSKAAAISKIAEELNVEGVVAFGDNLNDIPMLEAAEYPVAVGNAYPEVKAVARETIGDNVDDAVPLCIERLWTTI